MAKIVLGREFDPQLRQRVREALQAAGCKRIGSGWSVGGSQELDVEEWGFGDAKLFLAAETYMGLSLDGPDALVGRITEALGQEQG